MINLLKAIEIKRNVIDLNAANKAAEKYHKIKNTRKAIALLFTLILTLSFTFNCFAEDETINYQHNLRNEIVTILGVNESYIFTSEGWAIDINDIYTPINLTPGSQLLISYYSNDLNNPLDDEFVSCFNYFDYYYVSSNY